MKNLLKLTAFAMLFGMGTFITSCGDDDDDTYCYECAAFEDTAAGVSADAFEACEGDEENGMTLTKAQVDALVLIHEGFGGTCEKK